MEKNWGDTPGATLSVKKKNEQRLAFCKIPYIYTMNTVTDRMFMTVISNIILINV